MPRHRRRPQGGGVAPILGIVALAMIIVLSVGAFSYFKWVASHKVALDPTTSCPVTGPVSATAVLLDLTDTISAATLQDLRNRFDALAAGTPEGGLISIYGLTERPGELTPLFSACNPGDGSNVDPLVSNPRLAKQRWEHGYRKPFDEFMKEIGDDESASQSPIMAGVQKLKLSLFDTLQPDLKKTLIIASDMIEHTAAYSQYRSGIDYAAYEHSSAKDMYRTSLDRVAVTVLYIQRQKAPAKSRAHCDFWAKWFVDNKAVDADFIRLEGLN